METVGRNVIKLRKDNDLSQKELSTLSGVSRSYISEIEKDTHNNISIIILCSLCKALKTTPNELIPEKLYKEEVK